MNNPTSDTWTEEDQTASEPDFYGKWINASQKLPAEYGFVIGWHPDWGVRECYWDGERNCIPIGLCDDAAVYWMPLPEPPEAKR